MINPNNWWNNLSDEYKKAIMKLIKSIEKGLEKQDEDNH